MRKELLDELGKFCQLQKTLLEAWRKHCSHSHDLELLLDFPRISQFEAGGKLWEASKHGAGVTFRSDGVVVDVPYGVQCSDVFDSDRFFDYLNSQDLLALLGAEGEKGRELVAVLFHEWWTKGVLERRPDECGHVVFSLVTSGVQSGSL